MALGVRTLFTSDWGVGITGYATKVPESDMRLFAYYAISYQNKVKLTAKLTVKSGQPAEVQFHYTLAVLRKFSHLLDL